MARDQMTVLAASILGFAVLIIGSMGYMGVFGMNEIVCLVLMVVGITAVVGSMFVMMIKGRSIQRLEEE